MKAIVQYKFGSPDVLNLEDVAKPTVTDDQVLIRIRGAAVNPYDWHLMRARPHLVRLAGFGLRRPKNKIPGSDVAGTIEVVGENVTHFQPGDDVFGGSTGSFAEFVCVSERSIALKPTNVSFEAAAASSMAGITALQALRKGNVEAGHKVLINGASGGVGTFAVQIAKAAGAEVTGVCSTANVDMVRSIGADHVVDYTKANFTHGEHRYDLILDLVGTQSLSACRRILTPDGVYVSAGTKELGNWIQPITGVLKVMMASRLGRQKMVPFLAKTSREDLTELKEFIESGKVTPVIHRTYELSDVPDAIRYLEEGHVPGKLVIAI